ncbi:hypothetical protein GCM10009555_048280 [Acrocarpospora macrocephala]|uniref:Uncharacterized protein n=1 Tax=Acrocarpospora macrocephala TaxID=150177 RepID=A0A5M3XFZ2_9ACTN|nr:tetratricopeptide repeat protein [Acrocarpospora macrocephala]GES17018.1 hypothetical protein Amac_106160 [Acrocarpospora macrocephala]
MCVEQDVARLGTVTADLLECNRLLAAGDATPEVRLRRGIALDAMRDYSGALAELTAALDGPLGPDDLADAHHRRSLLLRRSGRYAEAELDATASLVAKLTSRGYIARAIARSLRGDQQGAWTDTERALLLNPGEWEARAVRGRAFLAMNRWRDAIDDFDWVIELGECPVYSEELRVDRAEALLAIGEAARAVIDCGLALAARVPCHPVSGAHRVHLVRARAQLALGDARAALGDCFLAAAIEPGEAEVFEVRAAAYEAAGCPEDARSDLMRANDLREPRIVVTPVTVS